MEKYIEHEHKTLPEFAIIDANTLSAIGLRVILEKILPMATIRIFRSLIELTDDTPDMYAHYFVSAQIFLEHNPFFTERRRKVIVTCGESQTMQLTGIRMLNIYQPEAQLVKEILKLHSHAHHDGHVREAVPPKRYPLPELSNREIEVLALIARGLLNKEIADRLNISLTTVITHRKNITEKLGIKSVSGLTIYAVMNGYVKADQI